MVLNYIWIAFFLIAFVVAIGKLVIGGDTAVFTEIINASFASAKTGFEISLGLTGILSLWLGIMKIGEKGGVIQAFARLAAPVFSKLFPDIPRDHPVTGSIFMNLSANLLGLDNAATPMGLKAMQQLQELNPNKESASNSMVMFLCLGTDLDPDHHHDVPGAVRSGESIRRIPADHARYIHINLSRYFSGLRTAEDQYPPTEPNPVFRGTGIIYRRPGMAI